jgi:hypothetical protein
VETHSHVGGRLKRPDRVASTVPGESGSWSGAECQSVTPGGGRRCVRPLQIAGGVAASSWRADRWCCTSSDRNGAYSVVLSKWRLFILQFYGFRILINSLGSTIFINRIYDFKISVVVVL